MGDIRTTEGEALPLTIKEKRLLRRQLAFWGTIGMVLAIIAGFLVHIERYVTCSGYVTTEKYAEVRPSTTGQVADILVRSGDHVKIGQVLVRLDESEQQAAWAEAQSQVRKLEAELVRSRAETEESKRQHEVSLLEARYHLEDLHASIQRIKDALSGGTPPAEDELSPEMTSLRTARDEAARARAQLARREAELAEATRQLAWDKEEARLVLENARGTANRTEKLVEAKLASGAALEEARLREELARVSQKALQERDPAVFDKELEVLRKDLQTREDTVRHLEASLRRRLEDLNLREKLAALRVKSLQEKDLTVFDKEVAAKEQELNAARESVNRAEARLRAREVRSPIGGQVLRYEFVIGELVTPQSVLFEIFGGAQQVLKLRVSERFATRVASDQRYTAELAPYRGGLQTVTFEGTVESLRNVIQAEGQETYRVAYCTFDSEGYAVPPGTTAEARIYYGRSNLWLWLFGLD